jgi:hypothetical protein
MDISSEQDPEESDDPSEDKVGRPTPPNTRSKGAVNILRTGNTRLGEEGGAAADGGGNEDADTLTFWSMVCMAADDVCPIVLAGLLLLGVPIRTGEEGRLVDAEK